MTNRSMGWPDSAWLGSEKKKVFPRFCELEDEPAARV